MGVASIVSEQVISLFIILIIGYLASSFGFLSEKTATGMGKLMVYVTNPLLIFMAFQQGVDKGQWGVMTTIIGISALIHIAVTVLSLFLFRNKHPGEAGALRFSLIFSNCGYMGYPLLRAAFPVNGMFYGACYVLFFTIYMWTVGVFMLSRGKKSAGLKKAILNPGVIAAVLGLVFCLLGIKLPGVLSGAINSTAEMTFPLAMLVLGNMLRNAPLGKIIGNTGAYLVSVIKLLVLPLAVLLICGIFNVSEGNAYIAIIMAATPCATKAPILAGTYGSDRNSALACTAITSLACVATIPLVLYLADLVL